MIDPTDTWLNRIMLGVVLVLYVVTYPFFALYQWFTEKGK